MARIVKTNHVYPPIPIRTFDWHAWFDGWEEDGPNGYGRTEAEAIAELYALECQVGGPVENFPGRPTCKPDGSCCDFACGN